jgi:23S rRNA pseudouridine1911/1915/1917 synthase
MSSRRGPRRFVVDSKGPRRLDAVLVELGAPNDALGDGRVRVDGRRAGDPGIELAPGSCVEVFAPRALSREPVLLGERDGLVVVDKPAELVTEPDRTGRGASVRAWLARERGVSEGALHAVSRLDVGVSGAVLFATSASARRRASELRAAGRIERRYLAIAERAPVPPSGVCREPVAGRAAETRYNVLAESARKLARSGAEPGRAALLALDPATGRTHQLRIHAEKLGVPLLGDRAHGGAASYVGADGSVLELRRVALHAARLGWPGVDGGVVRFVAPFPADLAALWAELGGAGGALSSA